jgi:5'-3' exonuclease
MVVIDFNQVAIASFMGEMAGRGGADTEVNLPLLRHMILNVIRSYKNKFSDEFGDEIVIACDNRRYWRREVFPFYKGHRKKAREESQYDWGAIFDALNIVRDELDEFFPYPVIDVEGAEADDVIGTLAEYSQTAGESSNLFDEGEPVPFLILSGDHDFNQLQKWSNVKQYSPAQHKWIKIKEPAAAVLMEHIITGDKGDGVPNMLSPDNSFVDGIRQKAIRKALLAEWKVTPPEEWITADMSHGYNRNQMLVDLSKTPKEIKENIINSYTKQQGGDRSQILNFFIKNKMKGLMDVIQDF